MRWWLALALVALPASGGVRVAVTPTASPVCQPGESLRRELARISGVELVTAEAELTATLAGDGTSWALVIKRGDAVVLERSLEGSCRDTGFASALIIERYVHELSPGLLAGPPDAKKVDGPKTSGTVTVAKAGEQTTAETRGRNTGADPPQRIDQAHAKTEPTRSGADVRASGGTRGTSEAAPPHADDPRRASGTPHASDATRAASDATPPTAKAADASDTTRVASDATPPAAKTSDASRSTDATRTSPDVTPTAAKAADAARSTDATRVTSDPTPPAAKTADASHSTDATRAASDAALPAKTADSTNATRPASDAPPPAAESPDAIDATRAASNVTPSTAKTTDAARPPGASTHRVDPAIASRTSDPARPATDPTSTDQPKSNPSDTSPPPTLLASRDSPAPTADRASISAVVEAPFVSRFDVLVSGGAWLTTAVHPGLALDVSAWHGRWRAAVTLAFATSSDQADIKDSDNTVRGTASMQAFLAGASVSPCLGDTWRACGGLFLGARIASGAASGSLVFNASNQWLARPTVGALLHGGWRPLPNLVVSLEALALVNPFDASFSIEGLPSVRAVPTVEGLFRLSAGFGLDR